MRSAAHRRGPAVVVANGAEGEPASAKDRLLLTRLPHLVMDGITLAADAVGAGKAYLCVHRQETRLLASLQDAADARTVAGIDPVPITIAGIPGRYVSSEQTAIAQFLGGGPAKPTFTPPRLDERGLRGRPTLENNVETLAHLALIARYGDRWFRGVGLPSATGSSLVTISGDVARPGVYEIELGTPIGTVIAMAGGPLHRPQAILVGGYFGGWMTPDRAWPIPLSQPTLRAAGGAMGAGILVCLPPAACGLAETARVVRYLAEETAGAVRAVRVRPARARGSAGRPGLPGRPGPGARPDRGPAAGHRGPRCLPPPGRGHSARPQRDADVPRRCPVARPQRGLPRGTAAPVAAASVGRRTGLGLGLGSAVATRPAAFTRSAASAFSATPAVVIARDRGDRGRRHRPGAGHGHAHALASGVEHHLGRGRGPADDVVGRIAGLRAPREQVGTRRPHAATTLPPAELSSVPAGAAAPGGGDGGAVAAGRPAWAGEAAGGASVP